MSPFKKAFLIATLLTLMPIGLMLVAAMISGCNYPVSSTTSYQPESSDSELYRWSTVKYDGHLYTCRTYGDSAAMVHSPSCLCLKDNK